MKLRCLSQIAPGDRAVRWLVDGLVPAGHLTSLVADGGTGKTILSAWIALHVASGMPLAGRAVTQGRVAFFDGEVGESEFVEQVRRVARGCGMTAPPEDDLFYTSAGALTSPAARRLAAELVRDEGVTLVILDSATALFAGIDSNDGGAVASILTDLREQFHGATLLLIDHVGKPARDARGSGPARALGSVAKWNLSRSVLHLARSKMPHTLELRQTKNNFGPLAAMSLQVTFVGDTIRVVETGSLPVGFTVDRVLSTLEKALTAESQTVEQLAVSTSIPVRTVRSRLSDLKRDGRAANPERGGWSLPAGSSPPA
jgi:hypothetical protein